MASYPVHVPALIKCFFFQGPRMVASPQLFSAASAHVASVSALMVLFGCFLAFMLSVSEFLLLSHTSCLTLSISGIFKVP